MPFICYLYDADGRPYMEVVNSRALAGAETFARFLLRDHPHGLSVEIFQNDVRLMRLTRSALETAV